MYLILQIFMLLNDAIIFKDILTWYIKLDGLCTCCPGL
jgi:hypothetical protein